MEFLHPGQYLQEIAGETPVEGVSTSTAAFVGVAQKGPIGQSELVTSWQQFVEKYGSYMDNSYLAYAVRGFFENGGTRAFISRAVKFTGGVKTSAKASAQLDIATTPFLLVDASTDGTWGNAVEVEIIVKNDTFSFQVYNAGVVVEAYNGLTLETVEDIVNNQSKVVKVTVLDEAAVVENAKVKLAEGTDGIEGISATDYVGDQALKTGLYAFENDDINIVAIPGITDVTVIAGIQAYVESRNDCTAIVEPPLGKVPTTVLSFKESEANISSERVALYYPWIKVADPIGVGNNPTKFLPPSGHIAGVYARTDNNRGVFKAPAGVEATVNGAVGLEYNITDAEQDILNPNGINAIRSFAGEGIIVWGARTTDPNFLYVPVRRSLDYIEQSILESTRWAVFEPNDVTLWNKLTSSIEAFLRGFWDAGGLKGEQEADAFFVQIDATTTTEEDINSGKVFANIGVSTQKPAEFIVFKVSLRN